MGQHRACGAQEAWEAALRESHAGAWVDVRGVRAGQALQGLRVGKMHLRVPPERNVTPNELKRAAILKLRIPPERRMEAEAVADRVLQPFVDREKVVDDGKRFVSKPNRETGHPDFEEVRGTPKNQKPYNFTAQMVAWLQREIRRELKLP